jgi:4-hydroxy-2-oxoheptanedioate aldolase
VGKARAKGVGAGIHYWLGVEQQIAWARAGSNLIINSSDLHAFQQTMQREIQALREALDGSSVEAAHPQSTLDVV